MPAVKCPYCGASYSVPEGAVYAVCPYCGTVVELSTGRSPPQYYYPPRLGERDAFLAAVARVAQLPSAPSDAVEASTYTGGRLVYVPLYLCRASASSPGCEGTETVLEEAVLATTRAPPGVDKGYRFPAAGREPYDPSRAGGAEFRQADVPPAEPCAALEARARDTAASKAVLSGCSPVVEAGAELKGVAHYPFWLVRYRHPAGSREYRAVVDAVDANVVYVEYPVPPAGRATMLTLAAAALGSSAAVGAVAAAAAHALLALPAAVAAGLAAGTPFLRRAAARTGVYKRRPVKVERTIVVLED